LAPIAPHGCLLGPSGDMASDVVNNLTDTIDRYNPHHKTQWFHIIIEYYEITSQPKYCINLFNIHTIHPRNNPITLEHIIANPITWKHNVASPIAIKHTYDGGPLGLD
jgi:hypothetical protein